MSKLTIIKQYLFLMILFSSTSIALANTSEKIAKEHIYALSFSKDPQFEVKNIPSEIAKSPNNYSDHIRLFAAYHYAGLLEGSGQAGHSSCPTSLTILTKTLDSEFEGAAKIVRFYCLSKTNKPDQALTELKQAAKYKEIPSAQNLFIDDSLRCLKDLKRNRHQDFITVTAVYAMAPIVNFTKLFELLSTILEKKQMTAKEVFNIGKAIELGAKKDFTNTNGITWFARGAGLKIQKNTLPYCTDGLIACKDLEIGIRKRYESLKKEREESAEKSKNSDFSKLLFKAQESGDPIAWINKSQNEFIKAVEKEDLWNSYLKLK